MATAVSRKTRLDVIMIGRCKDDDTFIAFQPMGIFRFSIKFFVKMSTAYLFFSVPTPYPVVSFALVSSFLAFLSLRSTIA